MREQLAAGVAAGLVLGALVVGVATQCTAAVPSPPGLHSVWCVKRDYPADLPLPVVVGLGTGLSGCPMGERQVAEP